MSLSIDDTGVRPVMGEDPTKGVLCIMKMLNMEYFFTFSLIYLAFILQSKLPYETYLSLPRSGLRVEDALVGR